MVLEIMMGLDEQSKRRRIQITVVKFFDSCYLDCKKTIIYKHHAATCRHLTTTA